MASPNVNAQMQTEWIEIFNLSRARFLVWCEGKKGKKKSASKTLVFFLQISMDSNFPLSPDPSRPLLLSVLHII